jgi:hypothetical protein
MEKATEDTSKNTTENDTGKTKVNIKEKTTGKKISKSATKAIEDYRKGKCTKRK